MRAKLHFVLPIAIFFIGFYGFAQERYWKPLQKITRSASAPNVQKELLFKLEDVLFRKILSRIDRDDSSTLQFPDNNGIIRDFKVLETPVFHPDLSQKYPGIQSFTGISIDKKYKARFSHSDDGLQVMLINLQTGRNSFIEKEKGESRVYRVYESNGRPSKSEFVCKTEAVLKAQRATVFKNLVNDQTLRKFRIAVSATGEYTDYHGETVAGALAAINATLTRVNEVFETDLGVTLELIPNNDLVVFTNPNTDPYNGNLNAQVQSTLTTTIGEENYDVGHLFHLDNDNGNAGFIGSVCIDNRKGSAFSSAMEPEGDAYDLDYVAHELGHQFGANHTWSFESEGTGVQAEPASGTTIMGYAGIVDGNNVAPNGDDYFHHNSIVQIKQFLETASCSQNTVLVNNPPVLTSLPDYIIPKGTAFSLTGSATDANGDLLTYNWEQIDDGVVVTSNFGPNNTSGANFRSVPPSLNPTRYFPRLSRVLTGELEQVNPSVNEAWETIANIERDLNFALTVRDNNPEGGQVVSDSVKVQVVNIAGPFKVTSQSSNEVYAAGSIQTVTWDVANTNKPPVNVETVDIYLSIDGGTTFSETLVTNLPNNGSANIQLPGTIAPTARLMVRASNSIFFAVNSTEFSIVESEAVLNFEQLSYTTCKPAAITIPFVYEAYGGFSETVSLTANSTAPFTISFSQNTVSTNGTDITIDLNNIQNVPSGTYDLEVVATSASFASSTILEISVFDNNFEEIVLAFPEDTSVGTPVNPEFTWAKNSNSTSFDIEIATDLAFTNIVETGTSAFTAYQSTSLLPETAYFWRVKPKNQCGEGVFGTPFNFTTSVVNCAFFDTDDQPQEITSESASTVLAKIFLAQELTVADINVNLELSHTYLEDLVISLVSPSGTRVVLISKSCGNRNNIVAIFDDDGTPLSCSGNPAISGTVAPLGSLSSFNGESTLGEWILEIEDTAASDGGSLDAFSLEICAEGIFRPDDDEDGVFDDGDDLCLGTPKGMQVNTSGCPLNNFPANNFSLAIQSESCRDNNDGSVTISTSNTELDYSATLIGNGINQANPFTEETRFSNLSSGSYQVCITGTDGTINFREACFDILVEEPEELSVLANLLANGVQLRLDLSGGLLYNIEQNGLVTQTTEDSFILDLDKGINYIKVTTGLSCRGVFEQEYIVAESPIVFPNPTSDFVTITSLFHNDNVQIRIFGSDGRLVEQYKRASKGSGINLDISRLSNGTYYLVMESGNQSFTSKLIKR